MTVDPPTAAAGYVTADRLQTDEATAAFYGELLRGMTHKLNNLLAVVQGFSSLAMMNDNLDASARENIGHMKNAAQSASGLTEKILSAGGCVRSNVQALELSEFFPNIDRALREPFLRADIPFQLNVGSRVPAILGDPTRLKEILQALLVNAAEAVQRSAAGGEVALDVLGPRQVPEGEPGRVDIFVRNTGSTIPEEKLQEIFRPFTSTKDSTHFGIGLTVAAVLAGQMNARLGVKSAENTTTFWLSVPVA